MLSLILAGGYSCGEGKAAAGSALPDALQCAHQPCDIAGSLAWGSVHHGSERFTSCFNHTPVVLLVHNSIPNADLDLTQSFETRATGSTTVERQCVHRGEHTPHMPFD